MHLLVLRINESLWVMTCLADFNVIRVVYSQSYCRHHILHIHINLKFFLFLKHFIKPLLNYTRFQVEIYSNLIFDKQQSIFLLRLFDQIENFQHPPDGARSELFLTFSNFSAELTARLWYYKLRKKLDLKTFHLQ